MADAMDVDEAPPDTEVRASFVDPKKASLPWVEKYRPSALKDLISHDSIVTTLNKLVDSGQLPHLLFYGPPGTGKTSTILALAKKMNGANYHNLILELNASDDRKIRVVREEIKDFASTRLIFSSGLKLIVLDEADAMTNDAQAALRRVIEKYTSSTRFCLICNHVGKISEAIQSRCTKFRFSPLADDQILGRLREIIAAEGVAATEDGIAALLRLANGDMRKILNVLQATSMAYEEVNERNVYLCTGNPLPADIRQIAQWMLNLDFKEALENIRALKTEMGIALQDVIRDVHGYVCSLSLPDGVLVALFSQMAEIERRLANGGTEKLQTSALIAAFQGARAALAS
eukprot:TRINITY_DN407_c1_g1_i1.p1 TRINITY_DN407_c1_g1~~TRINITY_DN407_c1_g1_i1.p1  ORF type:complete len:379 (+),score=86.19 TRINITY_DN407_c1_g1_i1:101-1138(+)